MNKTVGACFNALLGCRLQSCLGSIALALFLSPSTNLSASAAPSCVPAPSDLVGWWAGENDVQDWGGSNNGVLSGTPGFSAGEVGQSFSLNGSSQFVRIPASSSLNVGAGPGFTVEAWINPSSVATLQPIVEWNNGVGYGVHFYISVAPGSGTGPGCLYADIAAFTGGDNIISSAPGLVQANRLQHVALTYDKASGAAALYLDGTKVASRSMGPFTPSTAFDLYLGYRPPGPYGQFAFGGQMDEVTLYGRALTAAEILAIYSASSSGKCTSYRQPPTIVSQPRSLTANILDTVSLSVTATGSLPLSYQWFHESDPISGATGQTLTLRNLSLGDAGAYTVHVSNSVGPVTSDPAILTVLNTPNNSPTLVLPNAVTDEEVSITVSLAVEDQETAAEDLIVTATSLAPSVVPQANVMLSGTGAHRFVTLTPAVNQYGDANISVTVTDTGGRSTVGTLQLIVNAVNDPPTITSILDQFTYVSQTLAPVPFILSDVDNPVDSLTVTAVSSDQNLLPDANIAISGTGAARSLSLQPVTGQSGNVLVTVSATDGAAMASTSFHLQVAAIPPRSVSVVNATGTPGFDVVVPINLAAQGNENALGFSLQYDPSILINPRVSSSVSGAQFNVNSSQTGSGRLGILLALGSGQTFAAGTRELVRVTWSVSPGATGNSLSVEFGDQPILREVADPAANILPTAYQAGTIALAPGYEADVAPRPNGSNSGMINIADWVQVGRFAAGLDVPSTGSEFQRADCAPRLNNSSQPALGNGALTVADWVQAGRYAAGLDPVTVAGGPTIAGGGASPSPSLGAVQAIPPLTVCALRLGSTTMISGQTSSLQLQMDSLGSINALGCSITFDPAKLAFGSVTASAAAQGASLNVNTAQAVSGRIGIALALGAGQTFPSGSLILLEVSFTPQAIWPDTALIQFGDQPIAREAVSANAEDLGADMTRVSNVAIQIADTDGDLIPDYWETANTLNPNDPNDAALDPDGDGQSNLSEFRSATDPHNSLSALKISSLRFNGSDFVVEFNTGVGLSYLFDQNSDPTDSGWTPVTTLENTSALQAQLSASGAVTYPKRFYRLRSVNHGLVTPSELFGFYHITVNPGPNFISLPLHRLHSYRGLVQSVTSSTLTVGGAPDWTQNQFGPKDGFHQFVVLLRKPAGASPGHAGDWWPILSNTPDTLTVDTRSTDLSTLLAAGDQIEIRPLTSLKDLFGTGASLILNQDANGFANASEEDLIRFVHGTSFSTEIFYHNGALAPAGYYVDGNGPFDGSTITVNPDQILMISRKPTSTSTDVLVLGQVQSTPLAHYLVPGPNPIGTGFAAPATIATCGLTEAGWISDANGFGNTGEEDLVRSIVGTRFDKEILHHNGALADPGWYVNGVMDSNFTFEPGKVYFFFIKGPTPLVWRQCAPSP